MLTPDQPGWYPAEREGFQRYWNGSEWDDERPDPASHRPNDGPLSSALGCLMFAAVMLLLLIVLTALGAGGLFCELVAGVRC